MNPFRMSQLKKSRYEKVSTDEIEFKNHVELRTFRNYHWIHAVLLITSIVFFILGSVAFYLASSYDYHNSSDWCECCLLGSSYFENS